MEDNWDPGAGPFPAAKVQEFRIGSLPVDQSEAPVPESKPELLHHCREGAHRLGTCCQFVPKLTKPVRK